MTNNEKMAIVLRVVVVLSVLASAFRVVVLDDYVKATYSLASAILCFLVAREFDDA